MGKSNTHITSCTCALYNWLLR